MALSKMSLEGLKNFSNEGEGWEIVDFDGPKRANTSKVWRYLVFTK